MDKKELSTFNKITKVVVWTMIILTVGSLVLASVFALV